MSSATEAGAPTCDPAEVVRLLKAELPQLHGSREQPTSWRIDADVLKWIAAQVQPASPTLETGCGYTTIVLAAAGAIHQAISPAPSEHEAVLAWCLGHGIPTGGLRFFAGASEEVLPALPAEPLELVIIDGSHAFPWPFLDWFYTADRLRVGGFLIVDDVHLQTGSVLRSFLLGERGRWRLERDFRKASLFRKLEGEVLCSEWAEQPWGARPMPGWRRRLQVLWDRLLAFGR